MLQLPAGGEASQGSVCYERHRPEGTLLNQLVEEYYPVFEAQWATSNADVLNMVFTVCG